MARGDRTGASGQRSGRPRPGGQGTGTPAAGGPGPARRDGVRRPKPPRSADPRRIAYDVLAAVRDHAAYANLLLPRLLAERQVTGRDAALATELTYGTLRGQGSYDAVLAACSDRPLEKLDPPVLDVLRLGAHQLLNTRVSGYAAVATSVDLAKAVAGPRATGYVNAVLRRVSTRDLSAWMAIVAPDPATDRDGYLSVRYSHPRWIVAAYRDALGASADEPFAGPVPGGTEPDDTGPDDTGPDDTGPGKTGPGDQGSVGRPAVTELEAALAAGNARPRVTLAAFPAGPARDVVMPPDATPGRWSPYAFTLASGDPSSLIESGRAAVQDEASQLAVLALARVPLSPRPDSARPDHQEPERWLDLCAGPGGKARLLYGLARLQKPTAVLTAAELHPHRAVLVAETLARAATGTTGRTGTRRARTPGAAVLVADGTRAAWPDGTFDRVLVDAPCSGLGALRRRPEARWRKAPEDLPGLAALQRDLLRAALAAVRPGGVVAYVTCSPVPAETRDVVAAIATENPKVNILDTTALLPDVPDVRSLDTLSAQLWPHRHGTDAIFVALLRRGPQ